MKCLLLAISIYAAYAADTPVKNGDCGEPTQQYRPGDRYFFYPSDDDSTNLYLIDSNERVDQRLLLQYNLLGQSMNEYLLFTRHNPDSSQKLVYGDIFRLIGSRFNGRRVTVFLVHGWKADENSSMVQTLKKALLDAGDVNVIAVGWGVISRSGYVTAKTGAAAVGRNIGAFINWLVNFGGSYDRIHCVGYSVGAHVVGAAGRTTRSRVRRVTALDPAWPLWDGDANRLLSTDAKYVEVIHTSTLLIGYPHRSGDADFYPNGGQMMPGCLGPVCSHTRSHEYMYTSIKNNHLVAKECASVKEATSYSKSCCGKGYLMGNTDLNKSGTGIFRVNTLNSYPY